MFNLSPILNKYFYKDINGIILNYLIDEKYRDFYMGYYGMFEGTENVTSTFCGVCSSGCIENVIAFLEGRDLSMYSRINTYQYMRNNVIYQEYLEVSYSIWQIGMCIACVGGYTDIVRLMIEKGDPPKDTYWDDGLWHACRGGHMDIVLLMIEKGADNWNTGLEGACEGGHIDIVQLMIEKNQGGKCTYGFKYGFNSACYGGHLDIVILLIEKWAMSQGPDLNSGMINACAGGHLDIVKLLIEKGVSDWNGGLAEACYRGRMDIARLMIEKGAWDWNDGLWSSCEGGHMDIVRLMIEKGANDCGSCEKSMHDHLK